MRAGSATPCVSPSKGQETRTAPLYGGRGVAPMSHVLYAVPVVYGSPSKGREPCALPPVWGGGAHPCGGLVVPVWALTWLSGCAPVGSGGLGRACVGSGGLVWACVGTCERVFSLVSPSFCFDLFFVCLLFVCSLQHGDKSPADLRHAFACDGPGRKGGEEGR